MSAESGRGRKGARRQVKKQTRPKKKAGGARGKKAAKKRPKKKGAARVNDPSDTNESEVRFIQPYDAVKEYLCPGCNRIIPVGMGHMVAIPPDDPDLRRHWHRGCWNNRRSRR